VVAESFKDINTRAFWVLVIDALHTAMLGRFKPEALGLAVTGSYEKWRIVFFGSASRPPGSARQCIERTAAKPQLGALLGLHVHGSGWIWACPAEVSGCDLGGPLFFCLEVFGRTPNAHPKVQAKLPFPHGADHSGRYVLVSCGLPGKATGWL
jgi:hypothetical protein